MVTITDCPPQAIHLMRGRRRMEAAIDVAARVCPDVTSSSPSFGSWALSALPAVSAGCHLSVVSTEWRLSYSTHFTWTPIASAWSLIQD